MALIKCIECGRDLSDKAEACPHCGCPITAMAKSEIQEAADMGNIPANKKNKRIKPWWFIVGAAILSVLAVLLLIAMLFVEILSPDKYKWDEVILNSALPEPSSEYGKLHTNEADDLYLVVQKVGFSDYVAYVKECTDKGYTYIVESSASSYTAFNSEGNELELDYHEYDERLEISLDVRISGTIKWSNSKLAALLPVPNSNVGSTVSDYTWGYQVYIGNTTKAEFDAYISECEANGFNLNLQKQDKAFYAENKQGYELIVEYYECDLIYIDLDVPEDVADEEDLDANSNSSNSEQLEKSKQEETQAASKPITSKKAKTKAEDILKKDLGTSVKITKLYFNEEEQGCYVEFETRNTADAVAVHFDLGKLDYKSEFNYYSDRAKKLREATPIDEQALHECNQKILNSSYAEWSFAITVMENNGETIKNGWEKII